MAAASPAAAQPVLGYLANQIANGERVIPYSMVLGVDPPVVESLGGLADREGESITEIGEGRVVLGEWAAEQLQATPGDTLRLSYFAVGANDELETRHDELEVAGIAAMDGLMVDGSVLPDFPGIADADDIAAWEPPFPMDLGAIRPEDEAFWDLYRAAPKAVVNLDTARQLWANRFGRTTTVRVPLAEVDAAELADSLLEGVDPDQFGLQLQAIKRDSLEASAGSTDFAELFLAFSIFLIIAAALVVGLLFTLSIEGRAAEFGLRRAVGFPLARVRRALMGEGLLLAAVGSVLGILVAIGYAAVLISVIGDLWAELVDLPLLQLHVDISRVATAAFGSIALVVLVQLLAIRRLRRMPIPSLIKGVTRVETTHAAVDGRAGSPGSHSLPAWRC